jgi:hypothetical protein
LFSRPVSLAVVLCSAALLASCGGDDEDSGGSGSDEEAAVLETVDSFYASVLDGDGETACGLLTDEAISKIEGSATGLAEGQSCEELVATLADLLPEEAKEQAEDPDAEVVEIGADTATVETTSFDQQQEELKTGRVELDLVNEDGQWKIADFPQ